jgi:uncharacterized protein YjeT (DUF2065 family)
MQSAIQQILSLVLLFMGLSYFLYPRLWARWAIDLINAPQKMLPIMWIMLPISLGIVIVHNVWVFDLSLVITLLGWLLVIKSITILLFPGFTKSFTAWSEDEMSRSISVGGLVLFLAGIVLTIRFVL